MSFERNEIISKCCSIYFTKYFNLAIKYLSSQTGLTVNFTFKSFLITSHISLYFS